MYNRKFLFVLIFLLITNFACNRGKNQNSQEKLGGTSFRTGDLFSEDVNLGDKAIVASNAPGKNETIERSFENAPPLIPHKTDGFFPITFKNNICLSCHMPEEAKKVGSTPLPISHFTKYRPEVKKSGSKYIIVEEEGNLTSKDLNGKLSAAMYNCDQCHVPMTNSRLVVKNLFEPEFREESDKNKSDYNDKINEGIK